MSYNKDLKKMKDAVVARILSGEETMTDIKGIYTWRYDTIGTPKLLVNPNPLMLGKVEVLKVNQNNEKLKGAVFDIKNADGEIVETITTGPDGLGKSSIGLVSGEYTLVEKSAPSGYILDSSPIKFSISEGTSDAVKMTHVNKKEIKANPLPETGDTNNAKGLIFLLLGVGTLLSIMKKKSKQSS